jgi:hypothetical protein
MKTNSLKQCLFLLIIAVSTGITLISCHKEVSNEIDFMGLWREKGKENGAILEFTRNDTVYLTVHNDIHKYGYWVDDRLGIMHLIFVDNPQSTYFLNYSYDSETKELTMTGIYMGDLENPPKTIFIKD